jgi:2',3'-cyclic-nucleotide 2'-phosphodiesterase (5'-nucleotidase family)
MVTSCRYKKPLEYSQTAELQRFDSSFADQDTNVLNLIAPYSATLQEEMNEVIAYSSIAMEKARPQSLLGNFTCDLLLTAEYIVQPQICFMNYGGLRAPLPKGEIKKYHIYELMPFDNQLVLVRMDVNDIRDMFSQGVAKGGEPYGSKMDMSVAIEDGKLSQIFIYPIGEITVYDSLWVLTNDYIYNGGDGYSVFARSKNVIHTGLLYRDVLIQQIRARHPKTNPIHVELDNRYVIE